MRRLWFLGGLTGGGALMAIKLDGKQIEFNVGYRIQEVKLVLYNVPRNLCFPELSQISHAENTQIHRKTLQEDRHW